MHHDRVLCLHAIEDIGSLPTLEQPSFEIPVISKFPRLHQGKMHGIVIMFFFLDYSSCSFSNPWQK